MNDLEQPTTEHLKLSPVVDRIRSFPSDRAAAWGICFALAFLWLQYPSSTWLLWSAAVVGLVLTVSFIGRRIRGKLRGVQGASSEGAKDEHAA